LATACLFFSRLAGLAAEALAFSICSAVRGLVIALPALMQALHDFLSPSLLVRWRLN
jgi:hypothetical protein